MYTEVNFKTKKELKNALKEGQRLSVYQPNDIFGANTQNGTVSLEGPHYPKPHKWYARATIKNGFIEKIT